MIICKVLASVRPNPCKKRPEKPTAPPGIIALNDFFRVDYLASPYCDASFMTF